MMYNIQHNFSEDSNTSLEKKLKNLDLAYFMSYDGVVRMRILLTIDEIKIEMIKRGIYDKPIQ